MVGRFWERMVKSVKRRFQKAIGNASLFLKNYVRTLLVEVESVINDRSLTYVHDNGEGVSYALMPSHLIYGRKVVNLPKQLSM